MRSKVVFENRETEFLIKNKDDHIQSTHGRGAFYEIEQLLAHRNLIPMHSTVLDVGANVGNHTLFYAGYTHAGRIYPFEPNPAAREILCENVSANPRVRAEIDLNYAAFAIGKNRGRLSVSVSPPNNLGATRLTEAGEEGVIESVTLDSIDLKGVISFIKIDVEGMEMDVLSGADETIRSSRPTIAIEIGGRNEPAFWGWVREHGYCVVSVFCDYIDVKNYIVVPTS